MSDEVSKTAGRHLSTLPPLHRWGHGSDAHCVLDGRAGRGNIRADGSGCQRTLQWDAVDPGEKGLSVQPVPGSELPEAGLPEGREP